MIEQVFQLPEGARLNILSPVVRSKKGEHKKIFSDLEKSGFARVRVDGQMHLLEEEISLVKNNKHTIEVVVDRIRLREDVRRRLSDSLETALKLSGGLVIVQDADSGKEMLFSENYACPDCGISIEEISPRMFSFNSPFGACPDCTGLGVILKIDESTIVQDENLSIAQGAVRVSGWNLSAWDKWNGQRIASVAKHYGFSVDTPWKDLPQKARQIVLYGSGEEVIPMEYRSDREVSHYNRTFEGIIPNLERRFNETSSEGMKAEIRQYMYEMPCHACGGKRYRPETLAVKINGVNIAELSDMSIPPRQGIPEQPGFKSETAGSGRPGAEGTQCPVGFSDRCRPWLPDSFSLCQHAFRRRSAAHPPGNANWLGPGWRALYSG